MKDKIRNEKYVNRREKCEKKRRNGRNNNRRELTCLNMKKIWSPGDF